jgi:hypothetical protein
MAGCAEDALGVVFILITIAREHDEAGFGRTAGEQKFQDPVAKTDLSMPMPIVRPYGMPSEFSYMTLTCIVW